MITRMVVTVPRKRGRAASRGVRAGCLTWSGRARQRRAAFLARAALSSASRRRSARSCPQAPSSAPSRSSRPSRRSRSNGPGSDKFAGLLRREAEAGVVGRVAEQDHRAMATRLRRRERVVHQRGPDAELAAGVIHRQRAEHQRRDAPGADVPQPHGSDQPALAHGREGEAFGGRASVAQALAGAQFGGLRQSRHRAALRAQRRPRHARCGSRTERRR